MNAKKILALILALCLMISCFAGCGSKPADTSAETGTEGAETTEANTSLYPGTPGQNVITLDLEMEPTTINNMLASYAADFRIAGLVLDPLVMTDINNNPAPAIAESWDVSEDGLTYTFHLRNDVVWSNGTPVTAHDFEFGWKTILDPALGAQYAYFNMPLFVNATEYYNGKCAWEDVAIKAVDDYTFECTLTAPMPYFVKMLGQGSLLPVNEAFYNEVGADNYMTSPETTLCCGPFTLESWTHDAEVVLAKNATYYDADSINLDKMIWKIYTQSDTRLNAFKAGEVDVIALTGDQANELNNEGFETIDYLRQSEYHIIFNCEDEYMSNENLRKAFNLAYSRTDFINAIKRDASQPAKTFVPSPVAGFDGGSYSEEFLAAKGIETMNSADAQPELAVEYLEKALEELGCTRDDLSAHVTFNTNDSDTAATQAAFLQEAWRTVLGVDVTVKTMTTKALAAERSNGNFVIDLSGWNGDYNDPMTWYDMWVTGGGNNDSRWSNAEYDECIKNALQEVDGEKRQEYFYRCEEILNDECPIGNMYWPSRSYAVSGKIADYVINTWQFNFKYCTTK